MANALKYIFACLLLTYYYVTGRMEGFIYGGKFTSIRKYPHAAFLHSKCAKRSWICGASVLNQKILITAGHCVDECSIKMGTNHSTRIFLGHHELKRTTITRTVQNIVRHAEYDDISARNDIALVTAKKDIPLGEHIKRVIITPEFPPVYEGFVAGWGATEETRLSPVLKHVYQKLRSQKTCNQHGRLDKGVFCCTGLGKSAPNGGDSGSALTTVDFYQIGIVSFRVDLHPKLMVYTNVSYFYNWIVDNAKTLYCGTAMNF